MTDDGPEKVADQTLGTEEAAAAGEPDSVEEPTDSTADAAAEPVAAPTRPLPGIRTVVVGAAFVALLAATGFLGWKVLSQHQLNTARDEAQRAAVRYAEVLTSIDSNKVDENFKDVLDGATGEFKDMYSKSSVELRQLLIENKATAHGVVVESAVESVSKNAAVVLLFVDQSVANAKLPDPRIDRSRMKMTLEKVDGAWRAAKVELP